MALAHAWHSGGRCALAYGLVWIQTVSEPFRPFHHALWLHWRSDHSSLVALPVGYGHSDWRNSELGNRKGIEGKSPKRMNRASAAGLEAFTALLRAQPPNTGMASLLVQLMDPKHESLLYRFLSKRMGAVEKDSPCILNSARVAKQRDRRQSYGSKLQIQAQRD